MRHFSNPVFNVRFWASAGQPGPARWGAALLVLAAGSLAAGPLAAQTVAAQPLAAPSLAAPPFGSQLVDPQPVAAPPLIVGGYSPMPVREALVPARFAAARLPRHRRLIGVEQAERQVVAGTNYRLVLRLANAARWRVVVWQRLDRTMVLTSATRLAPCRRGSSC